MIQRETAHQKAKQQARSVSLQGNRLWLSKETEQLTHLLKENRTWRKPDLLSFDRMCVPHWLKEMSRSGHPKEMIQFARLYPAGRNLSWEAQRGKIQFEMTDR